MTENLRALRDRRCWTPDRTVNREDFLCDQVYLSDEMNAGAALEVSECLSGLPCHRRKRFVLFIACNRRPRAWKKQRGSVASFLNNRKLYIMGVYEYLEFGLFIFGS
jgi:hypothetical protein